MRKTSAMGLSCLARLSQRSLSSKSWEEGEEMDNEERGAGSWAKKGSSDLMMEGEAMTLEAPELRPASS